ncbi:MAG TPA: LLM class flavin-dependent oxidoreductase [Mycobacteriales bacterium]|jgi:alkanesulfonate monooxygenase SsuD/methylene tetrahydromethanopterin reductase-like flavin-dependent oxidoreductase (luciferase family)|nr:LLM class flavin-dependent oxidoreductase [Mycobacteriales bacterium]
MALPVLRYDFRHPDFASSSPTERYRTCVEQCAWGEQHGFDHAVVSEHHGLADGYLPSPLMVASAVVGRTETFKVRIAALLMPLYNTVRLAEDIAVLDLISGGRVRIVAGIGYRDVEFAMFQADRRGRGRHMEQQIRDLLDAWSGRPVRVGDQDLVVTPRPATDPRSLVYVGAATEIGARRAASLDLGFAPALPDPALYDTYRQECARLGHAPRHIIPGSTHGFLYVTEDPEKAWAELAKYAVYEAVTYSSEKPETERSSATVVGVDLAAVQASGVYRIVTPDECVALAQSLDPEQCLVFHPLMGGMPPDLGWQSLELFASKVLPRLS